MFFKLMIVKKNKNCNFAPKLKKYTLKGNQNVENSR